MNNFIAIQKKFKNKNHCFVLTNGEYFYVDFTEHVLSKISPDFIRRYSSIGMEEIITLRMSHMELLGALPGFKEDDD